MGILVSKTISLELEFYTRVLSTIVNQWLIKPKLIIQYIDGFVNLHS